MKRRKDIVTVNICSVVALVVLLVCSGSLWPFFLIVWLGLSLFLNYRVLFANTGSASDIRAADKKGIFRKEVLLLSQARESILLREPIFSSMPADDKMREMYDIISQQVHSNIKSAIVYMQTYDYVTRPSPHYLLKLCVDNDKLLSQLSELVEYQIRLNSTSDDVNTQQVDAMLQSLQDIINEK